MHHSQAHYTTLDFSIICCFHKISFQSAFYFLPWEYVPKGEFCKRLHNNALSTLPEVSIQGIFNFEISQSIKDEDLLQFMVHSSENETIQRKFCMDLDRIIYDFYSFVFLHIFYLPSVTTHHIQIVTYYCFLVSCFPAQLHCRQTVK